MSYESGESDPTGGFESQAEGVDRRLVSRLVVAGVALLVGVVFIVQNGERVETTFLVFSVTTRLWVGLLFALLLGALLGQAVEVAWHRRRRRSSEARRSP